MRKEQITEAYSIIGKPQKPDESLLSQFEREAEAQIKRFADEQERIREEAERALLQIRFR